MEVWWSGGKVEQNTGFMSCECKKEENSGLSTMEDCDWRKRNRFFFSMLEVVSPNKWLIFN